MPHRIIRVGIVLVMKPHELIAALMHRAGLGPLALAKAMGLPKLQPQIHRLVRGEVASPAHSTAAPLAKFFEIPLEAIYEVKAATQVATQRDLHAVELPPVRSKVKPGEVPAIADEVARFAERVAQMSPATRARLELLLQQAEDGGTADVPAASRLIRTPRRAEDATRKLSSRYIGQERNRPHPAVKKTGTKK